MRTFKIYGYLCACLVVALLWVLILAKQPLRQIAVEDPPATPPYPEWPTTERPQIWAVVQTLEPTSPEKSLNFDALDPARFWVNLISHELGPCLLVAPEDARGPIPAHVQLLVVTAGAAPAMETHREVLEAFARDGGLLILEEPPQTLSELAGLGSGPGDTLTTERLRIESSGVSIDGLPVQFREVTLAENSMPVISGLVKREPAERMPLVWQRPLGEGGVVGIAADLAALFLRHEQGTPEADFSFQPAPRDGALKNIPVPTDMTQDFPDFADPVLDRLERAFWASALSLVPVTGWWHLPGGAGAAYLCTHDEEGFGDRSAFMSEKEGELAQTSTFFVLPDPITSKGVEALMKYGSEVAVHWHRGFGGGNVRETRAGPIVVTRTELDLQTQMATVAEKISASGAEPLPPITRIHGLQWDADFDTTFARMIEAGIRLDSSYGPSGDLGPFRFGTLQPFRPLDRRGEILPILELPFSLQDDEAEPRERLQEVLAAAGELHLPVVPIFHTNTMDYKPSTGPIEAWMEGFKAALEQDMWIGSVGEYLSFLDRRDLSTITMAGRGAGAERGTIQVKRDGLWLRIPANKRGKSLERILVDDRPPAALSCISQQQLMLVLVGLSPGAHSIDLSYGEAATLCP